MVTANFVISGIIIINDTIYSSSSMSNKYKEL